MGDIQKKMFSEMQDADIFDTAHTAGKRYIENAFERHVFPLDSDIQALTIFDEAMPSSSSDASEVIGLLEKYGSPSTVAQIGGRYFGFVCGSSVPAGLAAKSLATYWDQNPAMYVLSPITSKLESVVEKWLKEIFTLPESTVAGFVSGSSLATFCGLAAARYRILQRSGWDVNQKGLAGSPPIQIIAGKEAHATVHKAIGLLGLGNQNVEWIDVDSQGRINADAITNLDANTILVLQAGNVCSGSFDNFEELCKRASKANAWVHIDGAFGLWAAATKKLSHLTKGFELASSWSVDGHKTLNTPYDSGIVLCKDKDALMSALHMSGDYIIESETRDGMFYVPEMSRRSRAIELWATMKYLGRIGIDQMVTNMHERAVQFADGLRKHGFEILNEVVFNQVVVTCKTDELTERTIKNIQNERICWVGGSKWAGRSVIRVSVSSWATTSDDVSRSVESFVSSRYKAITETS